jgi:hypothetical protein
MNRTIVVKTLLTADEYLNFDRACKQADLKHSAAIRKMANRFANSSVVRPLIESARAVQKRHTTGFRLRN